MALVDTKPEDLESTNALDDIDDGPEAADTTEIRMSGKPLTRLTNPPGRGDDVVLMIRVRAIGEGEDFPEDPEADPVPYVKGRLVNCWLPGQKEPKPQAEQKAEAEKAAKGKGLYDEPELPYGSEPGIVRVDGEPEALGDALGDLPIDGDAEDDDRSEDEAPDNVVRPPFSDGGAQ